MLGASQRKALVAGWSTVIAQGVLDASDDPLRPGDLVRLPLCVRHGSGPDLDVPGTVMGYAIGKDGSPSVVVDAPAWNGRRLDVWRTWIVNGDFCHRMDEAELPDLAADLRAIGNNGGSDRLLATDAATRELISRSWLQVMLGGVRTKAGIAIQPGDLVRLPRNVARNRGSQLHAAGLCLGYAVGLDGSPCVVADAVGEDVPTLTRWRTWVVRGTDLIVIDTKEAWRLESLYSRDGRPKPRKQR
ncbi:MAG: hypothetical protein Q4C09_00405 [Atopobiaceae bacterium]|nr:hypothetical protein [Atopobiaceae bacterium]